MEYAKNLESEKSNSVKSIIAKLYSGYGTKDNHDFYLRTIPSISGFGQYGLLNQYSSFLIRMDEIELSKSNIVYKKVVEENSTWWMRMAGYQGLLSTKNRIEQRISQINTFIETQGNSTQKSIKEREKSELVSNLREVNLIIKSLKEKEMDQKVIDYLNNM
mgnify:FL=1